MGSVAKPRVVALGEPVHMSKEYLAAFSQEFDYSFLPATNRAETMKLLPEDIAKNGPIDAFIIRMGTPPYEPFDAAWMGALLPSCKVVASASAGYNEFPVDWLAEQGTWFCNSVDAVAEATADMALFLMLAVLRNTSQAERSFRAGKFRATPGLSPARDPSGLTLGIVGMGAIGKYLAKKAQAFNMTIAYHNRHRLPAADEAAYSATYYDSLPGLLGAADVVSINCPLNAATTGLIGDAAFAAMKDGVFLVNTARGAVVDEAALKQAIASGKVARAGLDVFCDEPAVDPWFLSCDQVIGQPHLGGLTDVAFRKAETECFENVRAFFAKGRPNSPVVEIKSKSS